MTIVQYKNTLLIIFLTFVWTLSTFACSCEGKETVSVNMKNSDIVISGQVISRSLTNNYDSIGVVITGDTSKTYSKWYEFPTAIVKIKVDKMYKGQLVSDTLTILTPLYSAACGYYFNVGQKYIVYATIFDELLMTYNLKRRTFDNKTFWTHQCTRTQNWNVIEENEIIKVIK